MVPTARTPKSGSWPVCPALPSLCQPLRQPCPCFSTFRIPGSAPGRSPQRQQLGSPPVPVHMATLQVPALLSPPIPPPGSYTGLQNATPLPRCTGPPGSHQPEALVQLGQAPPKAIQGSLDRCFCRPISPGSVIGSKMESFVFLCLRTRFPCGSSLCGFPGCRDGAARISRVLSGEQRSAAGAGPR